MELCLFNKRKIHANLQLINNYFPFEIGTNYNTQFNIEYKFDVGTKN